MADNVELADANEATFKASTEEVTNLNGGSVEAQHVQRMLAAIRTRDGYAIDLPGDASNGLDVDVTRLPSLPAGTNAIGTVEVTRLPALAAGSAAIGSVEVSRLPTPVPVSDNGGSLTVDGTVGISGTVPVSDAGGSLTVDGTVALGSGSAAIGRVDVGSALPAGSNNIGQVDPRGNVAHDGADSGNPVKVGGRARTALPTAVAQDDRVDAIHDKFGRQLAHVAPLDQRRSGTANFTGTSGADVIAAPGSNIAIVVTRILVVNGHASVGTKVSVRDGTTVKVTGFAAPVGGGWTVEDPNGLFVAAANTAVTAICGTTGADVDVTVFGYLIPA